MSRDLQARKQQLVRNAIYDSAIDLFATSGFDETTVEEVAQAAGVSRRSFFRYFASKDDLLAQSVVSYGAVLTAAIAACPAEFTPLEVVRETVLSTVKYTAAQPRTRQIVEIAARSTSARQAYLSRMIDVEDKVAEAFAKRQKGASKAEMKQRLLANVTLLAMNATIGSWFRGEYRDLPSAAKQVLLSLTRIFNEKTSSGSSTNRAMTGRVAARPATRQTPGTVKR